jgi:uncharacterized membrane protein
MMHACHKINGPILWANLHFLFWLSPFPFTTAWMGVNHFTSIPSALYSFVLLMAGIAYLLLQYFIIVSQGSNSMLRKAVGHDFKGKFSIVLYGIAIAISFWYQQISQGIYILVALVWLVPDRRIENALDSNATLFTVE